MLLEIGLITESWEVTNKEEEEEEEENFGNRDQPATQSTLQIDHSNASIFEVLDMKASPVGEYCQILFGTNSNIYIILQLGRSWIELNTSLTKQSNTDTHANAYRVQITVNAGICAFQSDSQQNVPVYGWRPFERPNQIKDICNRSLQGTSPACLTWLRREETGSQRLCDRNATPIEENFIRFSSNFRK
uniref:Uncharacterized protein n=1 Tax=Glossina austeni TaxID=7395 RepID=A0A1A9V8P3_GLOAU